MKGLWKYFVLGLLLTSLPGTAFVVLSERNEPEVLSDFVEEVVTPTLTFGPTPTVSEKQVTSTPTKTPTPTPSPTSTPAPTPQPEFSSEQINAFIERFAAQYAVDPNVLRHIAVCESGFNPLAHKLSYAGLYQFSPRTWEKYRRLIGEDANLDLRFNAEEAVQTAAYVLSINQAYIWPSCVP